MKFLIGFYLNGVLTLKQKQLKLVVELSKYNEIIKG